MIRKFLLILSGCLALTAAVHAQTPAPTATIDPARSNGLIEATTPAGFPQLGFPNAPVSVVVYTAFDDAPSLAFHGEAFDHLITRARAGEVLITVVPQVTESIPNARGATRAALCAAEQRGYFQYADLAYTWVNDFGQDAFTGERLLGAIDSLGLDSALWQSCMISDRPDVVLTVADDQRRSEPDFTALPFVKVNRYSALTDTVSLDFTIDLALEEVMTRFEEALAETTPDPEATLDPEATPEPEPLVVDPLMGEQVPPPLELTLPEGWLFGYDTLLLQDVDAIRNIPLAVYSGPVTGGTGTIVLLWGFPNLVVGNPMLEEVTPDLWSDGTRLLRLAVVEEACNIGTDLRREYSIGGLNAIGTSFAAVDCPDLPDTRGWFAGLRQFNLNFVFYAFAEPIEAMDAAEAELQAILDTVRFITPELE